LGRDSVLSIAIETVGGAQIRRRAEIVIAALFTDRLKGYRLGDVGIVVISAVSVGRNLPMEGFCELLDAH
jgi:hypothetical protein